MFSQYCSSPALQLAQTRQESTMQPTAAMSPSLNFLTSRPTFTTRPTISWPGTHGYTVGITSLHSLRTWCKSEWQTPQKRISICTSCGRGDRRWIVCFASGDLGSCAANDFAGKIMGDGRAASLMASLLKNRNSRASWTDGRELCLTPRAGARLYESHVNLIAEVVDWAEIAQKLRPIKGLLLATPLLLDFENNLQLDRDAEWKACHPVHQTARVFVFPEDLLQQRRSAVGDPRVFADVSGSRHVHTQPYGSRHFVERP